MEFGGLTVVAFSGLPIALFLEDHAELVEGYCDAAVFAKTYEGGECILMMPHRFLKVALSQGQGT